MEFLIGFCIIAIPVYLIFGWPGVIVLAILSTVTG